MREGQVFHSDHLILNKFLLSLIFAPFYRSTSLNIQYRPVHVPLTYPPIVIATTQRLTGYSNINHINYL